MVITKNATYAVQIMRYLASLDNNPTVKLAELANETGIPRHAVVKVAQLLHKRHLVHTSRGSTGGIGLSRPSKDILLCEIVCAIDGAPPACEGPLEVGFCKNDQDCLIYDEWEKIVGEIQKMLYNKDLGSYVKSGGNLELYPPAQGAIRARE